MSGYEKRQTVISFENVSFQYPGAKGSSVKDINLDIKSGEFVVLTGGSGCGKTTITRIINGRKDILDGLSYFFLSGL